MITGGVPPSVVRDSSGVNAPLVDGAGNNLVNIPAWQTATVYPQGFVVQNGGAAYTATTTFTSGASFGADGANWAPLSSTELAYAAITSVFSTASISYVDVTGLLINVTTNGRPFMVKFNAPIQVTSAGAYLAFQILRTTDSTVVWGTLLGLGSANEIYQVDAEVRQALAAGTYAYKVQVASSVGTSTVKVSAQAVQPSFLQAVQI